ncbi:MAG: 3-oxoadipate enol-lactonase [Pseudomonadota bacterium]
MLIADLDGLKVHYRDDGDPHGRPVVFANSLGTDLRLWDKVIALLPPSLRLIRYDMRGHGLTEALPAPYGMADLVSDAEAILDHLDIRDCVFVGLSIGGIIAQVMAAKRLDQVRAMVISNTAAKIGTTEIWDERIAAVRAGGIEALADATMERWFGAKFRAGHEISAWRAMLVRQTVEGYVGCSAAIGETDLHESTARLTLPTLAIAGSEDGSTPPDLVRETAALIAGSEFHLIHGAGHLPCVEKPEEYADALTAFLSRVGHI